MLTLADFGAVGDGITDDTTAVINAINSCHELCLGDGTSGLGRFLISQTITIENSLSIYGFGKDNAFVIPDAFSGTIVFVVSPNSLLNNYHFNNFSIVSVSEDPGPIGICFVTLAVTQYISMATVDNLSISLNNAVCIASVNNNTDGLACLMVDRCVLIGGIFLNNAGDSVIVTNSLITGKGIGIFASFVPGASCFKIESNNITNKEGAIYLVGASSAYINNNNIENVNYGYVGTVDSTIFIQDTKMVTIYCNNINVGAVCSGIRLLNCYKAVVNRNLINICENKFHVWRTACTGDSYFGNEYIVTPTGNVSPGFGTQDGTTLYIPSFLNME